MISPDKDTEGVQFLQWCLPKLHFQWKGFRKVRKIVLKRVSRRMKDLGLSTLSEYRTYLENNGTEWIILDSFCRIPISGFYRDKMVFQYLEQYVFDPFSRMAIARKDEVMRWWSIGCASGEEPYFDEELQKKILEKIIQRLVPGGVLVIGRLEKLPEGIVDLEPLAKELGIYHKPEESAKAFCNRRRSF